MTGEVSPEREVERWGEAPGFRKEKQTKRKRMMEVKGAEDDDVSVSPPIGCNCI